MFSPPAKSSTTRRPFVRLARSVSPIDVMMLGAGSALGQSIFSVLGPAAQIGGTGILVTIALAALPMAVFAVVYAFLTSAAARSGASFEWPYEFIHPFVGYLLTWLRLFGQIGQLTTVALVLIRYLSIMFPLPTTPSMLALFFAVFGLNFFGVNLAARTQTIMMAILLSVFAIYVVVGAPHLQVSYLLPLAPHGFWPILLAAPLMVNLFMGIEASTEIGEEVRDAERTVPLAIAGSLCLITIVYLAVAFVTLGLIGAPATAAAKAPLIEAARRSAIAPIATPLILIAATLSLLKSLNVSFLLLSRSLFAMGRAGVLPTALARLSGRRRTPRLAIVVAFIGLCGGLFMPKTLVFLFLASNIPLILKYLTTCICGLRVASTFPTVFAAARIKLSRTAVTTFSLLGCVLALALFGLGAASDWKPYAAVGVWGLMGVVYWVLSGPARRNAPAVYPA